MQDLLMHQERNAISGNNNTLIGTESVNLAGAQIMQY